MFAITTAEDLTKFVATLQETLRTRNEDLRTVGKSKALHAAAQALGYPGWHHLKAAAESAAPTTLTRAQRDLESHIADLVSGDMDRVSTYAAAVTGRVITVVLSSSTSLNVSVDKDGAIQRASVRVGGFDVAERQLTDSELASAEGLIRELVSGL